MDKEVKLIMKDKTVILNNEQFEFLDYVEDDVQTTTNTTEIKGTDGVIAGASNFAPFDLQLRFVFTGTDIHDYHLQKHKLRQIIYQREPYYVWHPDMPGKKYAVLPSSTEIEDIYSRNGEITIKFSVIKGYSESLRETDKFSLSSGEWQFETGVLSVDDIKYKHNSTGFKIYNGSTDTIDPHIRHKFRVLINIDAPKGFTLTNNTTGDVFKYNKAIKKKQTLILNGVHPTIDNQRVGSNTNWQWITLAPGFNEIEITGENISNPTTQWVFPFIYR